MCSAASADSTQPPALDQNILLLLTPPPQMHVGAQFRWGLSPPESRSQGSRWGTLPGRFPSLFLVRCCKVSFLQVPVSALLFISSHCRANRPHIGLCPETTCSSPVGTGISGLHTRLTWGIRPRLEGKQRTPLCSRVATGISWSPLSGLKGVKPPLEFWERTRDCTLGPAGKEGPHLAIMGYFSGLQNHCRW